MLLQDPAVRKIASKPGRESPARPIPKRGEEKMKRDSSKLRNALSMLTFLAGCLCVFTGVAAAQDGQLVSADYGAGSRRVDVTSRVQSMVQNGSLKFRVGNSALGGDPAPKQVKELRIRLRWQNGRTRDYRYAEGDTVNLTLDAGGDYRPGGGHRGLRIVRARYGAGNRWMDVTATLQNLVSNDRLSIKVNNTDMGGDPAEGQHKDLRVEWEYRGRSQETRLREGDYLNLPEDDGDYHGDYGRDSRDLRIIKARYGAGNRWMDVTNTLQNLVSENRLNVKVNNTNMGGDPADDQHKELEVEWAYHGRRQETRLREGDSLNLPDNARADDGGNYPRYGDLRIISAKYGAGNRWLDVTATLQNLVSNNRLNVKVNNTNMGADPAEDQKKELVIEWEYQGQRRQSRLREGDYINIP